VRYALLRQAQTGRAGESNRSPRQEIAYPTAGLDAGLLEEAASLLEQAADELKG
jgi:hypothetical protein